MYLKKLDGNIDDKIVKAGLGILGRTRLAYEPIGLNGRVFKVRPIGEPAYLTMETLADRIGMAEAEITKIIAETGFADCKSYGEGLKQKSPNIALFALLLAETGHRKEAAVLAVFYKGMINAGENK